jgi:transcriptional regulator with XRE-family HTH domain
MESPIPKRLLKRVRALREAMGLTQERFAERAGLSYKYYQAVECGRKADLRLSSIIKLAAGLGVEVWQLFGPDEPTPSRPAKITGSKDAAAPRGKP